MARHHMTKDGPVPFTQAEEDARDAKEAQILADKPMNDWKQIMIESDIFPRWAEDLVDGAISSQTQKLADDKKILRGQRP
tara:strand:- start:109 stop:348 length:240 start_codon:yes stop_codon:yes gene_type:complete